tara:strand:+ start:276 stop:962 length:687 start_codon:yes stop_codon:yes gene_type:complete
MRRAGFTLAELLIALLLTAVAMGVIAQGVRHALDFQERIKTVQRDREQINAGLAALRARLERLTPILAEEAPDTRPSDAQISPPAGTEDDASILFSGTATRLRFAASDPAYPSTPGLYEYEINIESTESDDEDGHFIALTRRPLFDLAEFGRQTGGAQSWTLLNSRAAPTLSYGSGEAGWQSSWTQHDAYPHRIRLEFDDPQQPPLVVVLPRAIAPREETQAEGELTQ